MENFSFSLLQFSLLYVQLKTFYERLNVGLDVISCAVVARFCKGGQGRSRNTRIYVFKAMDSPQTQWNHFLENFSFSLLQFSLLYVQLRTFYQRLKFGLCGCDSDMYTLC